MRPGYYRKQRLSDLRESGAIEQDADLVALLYKLTGGEVDDPGKPGLEQDAAPVNLLIAGQRHRSAVAVALTILRAHTRFESAATASADDLPE